MIELFSSFQAHWTSWATAALVLLAFWFAGFFLFRVILFYASRWAQRTATDFDDVIIASSRYHIILWSFLLGAYVAGRFAPFNGETSVIYAKTILSLLFLSVTFLFSNIASFLIKSYGRKGNMSLPLTSLSDTLVRLAIIIVGVLVVLANLGISITPLLTALGVGSLAVALALQDTLSNLFAGFTILAAKQISPGDYIRLEGGQEGYVLDISWRNTRIRELSNNIIIIPNTKLGSSIVTNYYAPAKEMSVVVPLGVAYGSDLDKVERVTIENARETLRAVPGAVADYEPFIRYNKFGDSAVELSVILRAREFTDKFLLTHEFIKRIYASYAREGIEIPFPQSVVHIKDKERA